jgi:hypothetical protein
MTPNGGGQPTGPVNDLILASYDSYNQFFSAFKDAALG